MQQVELIKSGKWCEAGVGPVKNFVEGQIYSGVDKEILVKKGWAKRIDSHINNLNPCLRQLTTRALFVDVNDELFIDSEGKKIDRDTVIFGPPIDTKGVTSTYFVFDAPNVPNTGYRAFKIYHSHDPDGGFEEIKAENLIYGQHDSRFPVVGNVKTIEDTESHTPRDIMREGVVGTRQWLKVGLTVVGEFGGSAMAIAIQESNTYPLPDNRAWFASEPEEKFDSEDDNSSENETFEEILNRIVSSSESESDAKDKIANYLKGVMPQFKVDRRKNIKGILAELGIGGENNGSN